MNTVFDTDYYLIYQDIKAGDEVTFMLIDSTELEIPLATDSIYVIALAKDNGSYIETIGFLGKPSYGLICIPTPESGRLVDLGTLHIEETDDGLVLSSDIRPEEFASSVGFTNDMLEQFGSIDMMFKNLVNPDTNRNGIIDYDEGFYWTLISGYAGDNKGNFYDTVWLGFKFEKGFPNYIDGNIVEASLSVFDDSNNIQILQHPDQVISEDGKVVGWYFEINGKNGNCDRTYLLKLKNDEGKIFEFFFDKLRFYNPILMDDGFIFPQVLITAYSDGKVINVEWNWKIKKGNQLLDADSDVVKLVTYKGNNLGLSIDLLPKETFFTQFYFISETKLGAYDVRGSHNIIYPELEGWDYSKNNNINVKDYDYWTLLDIRHVKFDPLPKNTMFEILAPYNFLATPSNYEPLSNTLSLIGNDEKLNGIKNKRNDKIKLEFCISIF